MCSKSDLSDRVRVYFVAWGKECDPDAVSRATGIVPTKTWRSGDIRQERTGKTHIDSGWRLEAGAEDSAEVANQITSLLETLWPAHEYLKALSAECEMQFSIVVHCGETAPSVHLSSVHTERIGQLGASVDIDIYCH
jgi:hypothetical protein